MNKFILLIAYNRPENTGKVLDNLKKIKNISEYQLIVVRQEGNNEVRKIIDNITWIKTFHYSTDYDKTVSIKFKINSNMRYGIEKTFIEHKADFIVVVEDDILLGYDFLYFCEKMHYKFRNNIFFKGINAFSKERFDKSKLYHYSKFRYGVGKGWSINRKIWNSLRIYWKTPIDDDFDYQIEPWIRRGFVIMPYCSRSFDFGWDGASHTSQNPDDIYYNDMKKSWIGDSEIDLKDYYHVRKMKFTWRYDCYHFNIIDLRYFWSLLVRVLIKLRNRIKKSGK